MSNLKNPCICNNPTPSYRRALDQKKSAHDLLRRWIKETEADWTTDVRLKLLADTRAALEGK